MNLRKRITLSAVVLLGCLGIAAMVLGVWLKYPLRGLAGTYYANTEWKGIARKTAVLDTRISHQAPSFQEALRSMPDGQFSAEWLGYFFCSRNDPAFTFWIRSDDRSSLWIDDRLVVDHSGNHEQGEVRGQTAMTHGWHTIRIRYQHARGEAFLGVFWESDTGQPVPLTYEILLPATEWNHLRYWCTSHRQSIWRWLWGMGTVASFLGLWLLRIYRVPIRDSLRRWRDNRPEWRSPWRHTGDFLLRQERLWVGSGILSLLLVGFGYVIPFWLFDEETARQIIQFGPLRILMHVVRGTAIMLNLIAAWLLQKKYASLHIPRWTRAAYLLSLLTVFFLLTVISRRDHRDVVSFPSSWDTFYLAPDSASYILPYTPESARTPLYPWFIHAVGQTSTFPTDLPMNAPMVRKHPLLRVAQAQRILQGVTALFACYALMWIFPPSLPPLFFLWMFESDFFMDYPNSFILSEPLAQCWLLLLLGCFCLWVARRHTIWLFLAGLSVAAAFLTRPDTGIPAGVLFSVMLIDAMVRRRRSRWLPVSLAMLCCTFPIGLLMFYQYSHAGYIAFLEFGKSHRICYALQFAQPEDVELMPDKPSRQFFLEAMNQKRHWDEQFADKTEPVKSWNKHGTYLYLIAGPLLSGFPNIERHRLLEKVYTPLLRKHRLDHYQFGLFQFTYVLGGRDHRSPASLSLPPGVAFLGILGIGIVLWRMKVEKGILCLGLVLSLAHLLHLVFLSFHGNPLLRYVLVTQWILGLALCLFLLVTAQKCLTGILNRFPAPIQSGTAAKESFPVSAP